MNNNDIEDIKQLESLKLDRESFVVGDKEHDEIYLKDIQAIENILADRERLEKENEIYKEEYQKITKALDFKEGTLNPEPSIAIEAIKKALMQGQAKANKYDRLVERIKSRLEYAENLLKETAKGSLQKYTPSELIFMIKIYEELMKEE